MADLTSQRLPLLLAHRLPDFDLGADLVYPHYAGNSILNIPSSVCKLLGAPQTSSPPLDAKILDPLGDDVQRVVVIIMDALSLHRLQRWIQEKPLAPWPRLIEQGVLAPLTSITPSTTAAAMSTFWTGRSPAEHGIVGYEVWLKEFSMVANMILHTPITYKGDVGGMSRAGFKPDGYLPAPNLGTHLQQHGIHPYAFQHASIVNSGLSQMILKDVNVLPFGSQAELWPNLTALMTQRPAERQYIWVYWSEVDHYSHVYGPDDARPAAEFEIFSYALENFFLRLLPANLRQKTVLILAADHGQLDTPKDPHYELRNHPSLTRRLHINPTGENRLPYLYIRPGQVDAVREYLDRTWPNQFTPIDPASAVQAGLFGPGIPHSGLADRLGDLILVTRGGAYLWWAGKDNPLLGRHGGLSPDEMLVPFVAARLD